MRIGNITIKKDDIPVCGGTAEDLEKWITSQPGKRAIRDALNRAKIVRNTLRRDRQTDLKELEVPIVI